MVEKISRSEQKRLFKQVEELARELSDLSDNDLKVLPADSEVKENILACRGLKSGALKRQIKYLAKILRQDSLDDIYLFMKARKGSDLKEKQLFHRAERWRDILINEALEMYQDYLKEQIPFEPDYSSNLIRDISDELPGLNQMDLRRVIYSYVKTRNKMHHRELFRMIKAAVELESRR